jgi:hypothetical protein
MANYGLTNNLSALPLHSTSQYDSELIVVENNAGRPITARATFITNLDDISVTLAAGNLDVGSFHIEDPGPSELKANVLPAGIGQGGIVSLLADTTTGLLANIVDIGDGQGALRVLSQDLESSIDDITIGDRNGNFAYVTNSALNVFTTNGISAVSVTNFPTQLTAVSVTNFPTQLTAVSVTNQLTGITVLNPVSSFSLTNQSTSVNVTNFPTQLTAVSVTNFPTQLTAVSVTNQLTSTSVTVLNPVTSVQISNSSIEISNDIGNPVPVNVTNTIVTAPLPTQLDAFGRLRVSTPLTLFDSSHRYKDNNLWSSLTAVGGSYTFNQNQGLMDLTVNASSGSSVIRETTKVFAYQPGKSLLVMNTFVMASSATNLRQRVGYYGQDNGIYFQLDDGNIGLVKRSLVSGSVIDTVVSRSDWNGDKLDGTGASGLTLDITKAQILWMDIEWLGLGSVRVGFIINGQYILCHTFHHANLIASTYITTASLPLRYEITNKADTGVTKTMKQICSTVISEGGYELRGLQQAIGIPVNGVRTLGTSGTFYPVISLRLKASPNRLDAIAILTALSVMPISTANYNWQVRATGTTTGGSWVSAGIDSCIEYNISAGTTYTGGRILASGFFNASNHGATQVDILKEALFKFQLERDGLAGVPYELTLVVASDSGNDTVVASMDWEEISR